MCITNQQMFRLRHFTCLFRRSPICYRRSYTTTISGSTRYMVKSISCGEVYIAHENMPVTVCGWIDALRTDKFVILRDSTGLVQVTVVDDNTEMKSLLSTLHTEDVLGVSVIVSMRKPDHVNDKMSTGRVEIIPHSITLLNSRHSLPVDMSKAMRDELALQYRYLYFRKLSRQ